ncbi:MAG: hypothetical protein JSV38_01680, partial [Desulfobacterales bacterium]
ILGASMSFCPHSNRLFEEFVTLSRFKLCLKIPMEGIKWPGRQMLLHQTFLVSPPLNARSVPRPKQ